MEYTFLMAGRTPTLGEGDIIHTSLPNPGVAEIEFDGNPLRIEWVTERTLKAILKAPVVLVDGFAFPKSA